MPKRSVDPLGVMPLPHGSLLDSRRFLNALEVASVMFATTGAERRRSATSPTCSESARSSSSTAAPRTRRSPRSSTTRSRTSPDDGGPAGPSGRSGTTSTGSSWAARADAEQEGEEGAWRERKEAYIAGLEFRAGPGLLVGRRQAPQRPRHRGRPPNDGEKVWKRFTRRRRRPLYYGALVGAFRANPAHPSRSSTSSSGRGGDAAPGRRC